MAGAKEDLTQPSAAGMAGTVSSSMSSTPIVMFVYQAGLAMATVMEETTTLPNAAGTVVIASSAVIGTKPVLEQLVPSGPIPHGLGASRSAWKKAMVARRSTSTAANTIVDSSAVTRGRLPIAIESAGRRNESNIFFFWV